MGRIINKYVATAVATPKQVDDLAKKINDLTTRAEGMEKTLLQDQIDEATITHLANRALERAELGIVDALNFKKVAEVQFTQIDVDQKAQNLRLDDHDLDVKQAEENFADLKSKGILEKG